VDWRNKSAGDEDEIDALEKENEYKNTSGEEVG
jgi:hypothetical protein